MLGPAAHHHLVAAGRRQGVPQGLSGLQVDARLVDIGDLQVGPELDGSRVGPGLAQQQLDQGGLAGAVGPDHRQPVAAHHPGGEVLEQDPLAPGLVQPLDLDHPAPRPRPGFQSEHQRALGLAQPYGLLLAHRLQLPQTTLVARAPGGDAARHPVAFAFDGDVQAAGRFGFSVSDPGGPGVELAEALVQAAHLAAGQPEAHAGQPLQEGAVVADRQDRRPALFQPRLQGLDGQDVQVVGGLVEQQHVGLFGEGSGQGGAADLAARQARGPLGGVEAEALQLGLGAVRRRAAGNGVVQEGGAGDSRLLRHLNHPGGRRHGAFAGIGFGRAGQDAQQGRLAGAVAAHQAGAGPRLQSDVDAVEQLHGTVAQGHVLEGQDRGAAHLLSSSVV